MLEKLIFEKGESLIKEAKKHRPKKGSNEYLNNIVFDMCMKDPYLKTQLFRFIDVLPVLDTEKDIIDHLKEYIFEKDVDLSFLTLGTSTASLASKLTPKLVAPIIKASAKRMANSFIAGKDAHKTLDVIKDYFNKGMSFTLDILGEVTTSEKDADVYMNSYFNTLDVLVDEFGKDAKDSFGKPKINVSVKISSLYSRFNPIDQEGSSEGVKSRLRQIFRKAKEVGASVNIDTEHYQFKDLTYKIFKELLEEEDFKDFDNAGIVVQAYLKDSEEALKDFISWSKKNKHPITIRLVKGAYWDHEVMLAQKNGWEVPVYTKKWKTDANFEKLTKLLLENSKYTHAAIASHNIRSIANAIALKEKLKVKDEYFEIQLLHGIANETKKALVEHDIYTRVYTTMGEEIPGMGYFMRRLLENSSNEAFVRAFDSKADPKVLLRNPKDLENILEPGKEKPSRSCLFWMNPFWMYNCIFGGKKEEPRELIKIESEFTNAPACDFSKEENRKAMHDALKAVKQKFGTLNYKLKIGGQWIDTGAYIESRNPSKTSEVIGKASKAGKEHIEKALTDSKIAFETWQYTDVKERAGYLYNVASQMQERIFELSALIVYEGGKTWTEAYNDVNEAVDFLNFYGKEMERLGKDVLTQEILGEENITNYIPKGTVAVIAPWNFPLAILAGMTSVAVVTGNTVVMKPSSDTSLIAGEFMKMFEKAGLPNGVLNYVPCSGKDAGDYIVDSPLVDMVALTGSKEVGLGIYERISKVHPGQENVKLAVLEMGGKNGIIVDKSADLDLAVPGVLYSAFGHQGQKCSACSRLIVVESVYDKLIPKLVGSAKSLNIGDAALPGTDVGPIINSDAYSKIKDYVEKAKAQGGNVLLEGECSDADGFYIGPTIIEVNKDNVIAKEEVFGPVLAVIKVKDFDEAMDVLNDTEYALTGGEYSRTPSHIERFKREAKVGNRDINRGITGAIVERQPFGGFKMSGAGSKAGGRDYLLNFMYAVSNSEDVGRKGHIPGIEDFVKNL